MFSLSASNIYGLKKDFLLLIFLGFVTLPTSGQNRIYTQEFQLTIDNDAFLFPSVDRYYSSGLLLERRIAIERDRRVYKYFLRKFPGLKKIIWGLSAGHNFYTSRRIKQTDVSKFDRPYAGWLFAATSLRFLINEKSAFKASVDMGVVGPAAGGAGMQKWWHETIGLWKPQGWDHQLKNSPAINLKLLYQRQVLDLSFLDLVSESGVQVGTIQNNLRQGAVLRLIKMKPLYNTIYTQSKIGSDMKRSISGSRNNQIQEVFLIGGAEVEYVLYNSLIEGNFIGKASPHVEIANPWVIHWKYGLALGSHSVDAHLTINHVTAETTQSKHHSYASMDFAFRF